MTDLLRGLDVSFSRISLAWAQARKAEGYAVLYQDLWSGLSSPTGARDNLQAARNAGLLTGGYLCVHGNLSGSEAVQRAKAAAGDEWPHLSAIAIDVEIDGVTEGIIAEACMTASAYSKVCIYSADWFWKGHLGNPQWPWLANYPKWWAAYDGKPELRDGWMGHQYQNTTNLDGVDVDLNVFDPAFFEEDSMTPEQAQQLADLHAILTDPQPLGDGTSIPRWLWVITRLQEIHDAPGNDPVKAVATKLTS